MEDIYMVIYSLNVGIYDIILMKLYIVIRF